MAMSEEAKEARRAYAREYYKKNKDRIKESHERHWEKKAKELAELMKGSAVNA